MASRFAAERTSIRIDASRTTRYRTLSGRCTRGRTAMPSSEVGLGVTRTGRLTDMAAFDYAASLQGDRLSADYGLTHEVEPYDPEAVDERLAHADYLITDLKTLL